MTITRLSLTDFRNYPALELELRSRQNFFIGPNGAGKTNLLEAVRLGALGRSHRAARDADLARWGCRAYRVVLTGECRQGTFTIDLSWRHGHGKQVRVDGVEVPRLSDLLGLVPVVMFAPQDLDLVQGSPRERRRYLDLLLCQLRPAYYHAWSAWQRVLAHRNRLLTTPAADPAHLATWDAQLVATAVPVFQARARLVARLTPLVAGLHAALASPGQTLSLVYRPGLPGVGESTLGAEAPALAVLLEQALVRVRGSERRRGTTLVGPHRDDLGLLLDGRDARLFASQGQQRTAALALRLAELRLLTERKGEPPLLLLDDVLSELDAGRRTALVALLRDQGQTLVTAATSEALPPADEGAAVFWVEGGNVLPLSSPEPFDGRLARGEC